MALSSAQEAIIRGSPPPQLWPLGASASHPAAQTLGHHLAGIEEDRPLLTSTSHNTSLSRQYPPQSASSLTTPQLLASHKVPPSQTPKQKRPAWTSEQDALLLELVKQHGPRWAEVVPELNKAGGPQRTAAGALQRHRKLQQDATMSVAAATALTPSSSSSSLSIALPPPSHPQQQQQQQSSLPTTARRASRKGSKPKRWTSEEDAVLAAISQTHKEYWQIHRASKEALPGTERTEWAVVTRWQQMYHRGRTGRGSGGVNGGGGVGDERTGEAAVAQVGDSEGAAMVADWGEAATYGYPHQAERIVPAWPLSPSAAPDSAIKTSQPAPPSTTIASASASVSPRVSYTIDYLWNGFLIRNFPPYHELRIHSPTSCQVIEPDAQAASLNSEPEEEQSKAPFAFTVEPTGLVQALTLPAGTQTSISILETGHEDGHQGGVGGKGGQAKVVETHFEAPDGYIVVFQNQLGG